MNPENSDESTPYPSREACNLSPGEERISNHFMPTMAKIEEDYYKTREKRLMTALMAGTVVVGVSLLSIQEFSTTITPLKKVTALQHPPTRPASLDCVVNDSSPTRMIIVPADPEGVPQPLSQIAESTIRNNLANVKCSLGAYVLVLERLNWPTATNTVYMKPTQNPNGQQPHFYYSLEVPPSVVKNPDAR